MNPRQYAIRICRIFLLLVVFQLFFSNVLIAFAAEAKPTTTTTSESAEAYGKRVLKDAPAVLELCGIAGGYSYYYCGGTATEDATKYYGTVNPIRVDYKKGDQLKCYIANIALNDTASVCALTSGGVTKYTEQFFTGSTQTCVEGGSCEEKSLLENAGHQIIDGPLNDLGTGIVKVVGSVILEIANFLLGVAGTLLNWVVVKTVFEFGSLIGNSPGVLIAWGIFRDIGNMILLFGFIFMGLATILNINTFSAQKALPRLLIFAVLMNFSLFAAEAVIDATNAVSSVMYSQANTDFCLGGTGGGAVVAQGSGSQVGSGGVETGGSLPDCAINYGIAGHIMQSTGLATMWKTNGDFGATTVTYVGLALFATIGAVVLFAAAIMLATRLIVLSFLMVTSPIGFAGMAIPPMQRFASMWWSKLISQAIFAPVLFLLIFVSLKITDSFALNSDRSLAGALTQPNASVMGIIMVFVIVIGFLVGSLMAAKSIGAQGATGAISFATKTVRGAYGGIGGAVGRNTIGRGSAALQKRYESRMGKAPSNAATKFARSALRATGIDNAVAGTFAAGKTARFGSSSSFKEKQDKNLERSKELEKAGRASNNEQAIRDAQSDADIAKALSGMSDTEISELTEVKKNGQKLADIARNLSPEAFEKLMNNKELGDGIKQNVSTARFSGLKTAIASNDDAEVRKWSAKDLESLAKYDSTSFEQLLQGQTAAGASLLSNDQFETLQKSNNISNAQKQVLRDESLNGRIGRLVDRSGGRAPSAADLAQAQALISSIGGAKNVAKLSATILTDPSVGNILNVSQLAAIITEDKLTQTQQHDLALIVQARARSGEKAITDYLNPVTNPIAVAYYTP